MIPYALDGERPARPEGAVRGKEYLCPECQSTVRVRGGTRQRVKHFYHLISNCNATAETIEHLQAKLHFYDVLKGNKPSAVISNIIRSCVCGKVHSDSLTLDGRFKDNIEMEYSILDGQIRADLAALNGESKLQLVVEITKTNSVSREKAIKFGSIPWVEIPASGALTSKIYAINSANLRPLRKCPKANTREITKNRSPVKRKSFYPARRKRRYRKPLHAMRSTKKRAHKWIPNIDGTIQYCRGCQGCKILSSGEIIHLSKFPNGIEMPSETGPYTVYTFTYQQWRKLSMRR